MNDPLRVLLVDDSDDDVTLMLRALRDETRPLVSRTVQDGRGMQDALEAQPWDVILCDSSMPQFGARAALQLLRDMAVDVPLIVVSGSVDDSARAAALTAGAKKVVPKKDLASLRAVVDDVCRSETPLSLADERAKTPAPPRRDARSDFADYAARLLTDGGTPSRSANLARSGPPTVLVLESDDQARAAACQMLRDDGYRVLEAQNAGEVLLIGRQRLLGVDLLLAEVLLPRVNALDLVAALQAAGLTPRVVFMSAEQDDAIVHYGVVEAGLAFVPKPLTQPSLSRRVRQALRAPGRDFEEG